MAKHIANVLDRAVSLAGQAACWLLMLTAALCFASVYLRYGFDIGLIWLQELYVWTHVLAIMLGAAWVMGRDGFVRVDIFYRRYGPRQKAAVDAGGHVLFLLPFLYALFGSGWQFFWSSWRMGEGSTYETGLPALYILKGSLLVFAALILAKVAAQFLRLFADTERAASE